MPSEARLKIFFGNLKIGGWIFLETEWFAQPWNGLDSKDAEINLNQESIPVGCVPPACQPWGWGGVQECVCLWCVCPRGVCCPPQTQRQTPPPRTQRQISPPDPEADTPSQDPEVDTPPVDRMTDTQIRKH